MNLEHLRTFIWLRFRLQVNQLKRGGVFNGVLLAMLAGTFILLIVGLLVAGFLVGLLALSHATPAVRLWVWDGITVAFLFTWMIGLLADLQRTDGISPEKFLHLPVSPVGAFVINYVSSLFNLTTVVFVPGIVGLLLGQTLSEGPQVLLAFPLLVAFLLAVSALSYQFQGWLASLMTNPRQRRTVVAVATMSVVALTQLPNLARVAYSWDDKQPGQASKQYTERLQALERSFKDGQMSLEEYQRQSAEAQKQYQSDIQQSSQVNTAELEQSSRLLNAILPPGWFALGVAELATGSVLPGLLGTAGLTVIGSLSLWRAYRTTLRLYTGHQAGGMGKGAVPTVTRATNPVKLRLVEWQLPVVSEQAAAVATAGIRSLWRAPEAKVLLIVPVVIIAVSSLVFVNASELPPLGARPFIAFAVIGVNLIAALHLIGNQFGYDRDGFRTYVLSPIPRRDILLGKNIAVAPYTLGMVLVALGAFEIVCPMRVDHFLVSLIQAVSMYLLYCLLASLASILAPQRVASGMTKPSSTNMTSLLVQFAMLFGFPLIAVPLLVPLGVELVLVEVTGIDLLPLALPLAVLLGVGVAFLYRFGLTRVGRLLAKREQAILLVVTSKTE